ncbi:M48 family metallopeptidase [Rhodohalobacter sp. SW132]|uniref:tetratricopeptide repeat protein n=1 Tax=Rhodohalobacter sp. SW132 TaxID=2293433 RepID=UPI001315027E|nr:tetratricopeptide repeat protein [Rhodohalobacter sp. SW132]
MNRLYSILITVVLLLTLSEKSQSQTPVLIHDESFQNGAVEAIDSLYNRNTEAAHQIMQPWRDRHPDHPIWSMWEAMELWWQVLEDLYDHSLDDQLMEMMQRSEYEAGRLLNRERNHPDALIIRALANGYIARHYANRDSWITSVRTARRAYVSYEQLMEVEPDFIDNEFVRGMVLYYAAYIPDEYPVVRAVSWFLPDGDRKEGLNKIDIAASDGIFSRPEASYFMGNILLNYEKRYAAAMIYLSRLVEDYPNNSYYRRLYVRTLANQNRNNEVLEAVESAISEWKEKNNPREDILLEELRFWEGRALYRMNRFEEALEAFNKSIEYGYNLPNRSERLYYSVANYYAGLTSEALQQRDNARSYYTVTVDQNVEGNFKSRARERLREL